jgi:hypothetical protein
MITVTSFVIQSSTSSQVTEQPIKDQKEEQQQSRKPDKSTSNGEPPLVEIVSQLLPDKSSPFQSHHMSANGSFMDLSILIQFVFLITLGIH